MAPGTFNTKSPTIKRIMREAAELSSNPSPDYHAAPLESNIFEWHFTLRGPSSSPFEKGIYHGRITLPNQYPLRPPSFRFLTPSGRFEVNREICLSISGFHEEMWQPAWGVRTALIALRSHMEVPAKGQVGGIESDEGTRRRLAGESGAFVCQGCGGRSNEAILKEQEELAKAEGSSASKEAEKVPEELRLAYREDLGGAPAEGSKGDAGEAASSTSTPAPTVSAPPAAVVAPAPASRSAQAPATPTQANRQAQARRQATDTQLDAAIWLISAFLVILVARWILKWI